MQFRELHLIEPILKALDKQGYSTPTPIQAQAIPHILAGKDVL
jgi:ATP-dependent RNA helicase RhlE